MNSIKKTTDLSCKEIDQLEAILKGPDTYSVRNRAHAMLLIHKDKMDPDDVAKIFNVHHNTIYNWMKRWEAESIDGMYDKALEKQDEFDLVYFDASGFCLQPFVPYSWQDVGREGTIGIPSSNSIRINVLGFLNPGKNELSAFEFEGSIDSHVVIAVMDAYCREIDGPTIAVIDNAPIHTSKAVQEKIMEWEKLGLTLHFIPPYSPQLNLIEIIWRKMKYEWLPAWAYKSIDELRTALDDIICNFGSTYKIDFSSSYK